MRPHEEVNLGSLWVKIHEHYEKFKMVVYRKSGNNWLESYLFASILFKQLLQGISCETHVYVSPHIYRSTQVFHTLLMNDEVADMTSVMSIKATKKKIFTMPHDTHTHTCISTVAVLKTLSQPNTNLFLLYCSSTRYMTYFELKKKNRAIWNVIHR